MKVVSFEGKHKLADRWQHDPYVVLSQPNEGIPVFKVRKEKDVRERSTETSYYQLVSSVINQRRLLGNRNTDLEQNLPRT